ncbi:MAG: U32 family peptidase [Oscillospiraceae bacterium]|nr:U32 family peptidase [Oscillospiraceae bacterium]
MIELLAPAGSMEALQAAVQNGANAVYLGSGMFNARQGAKNFSAQSLQEAVRYCHVRGVAVHLTLNTLVSDKETGELCELIRQAALAGVDAFIVQDLGVIRFCKEIAPHIPLHGSTQMTIHSLPGVQLCAAWGMSRVVLSRELNREEIAYICKNSPIEIEVFGHGALCMCYSGQCYLSSAIGGRSGNRGRCAQPCRQSYGYGRWENRYPLSLKDNCLIKHLQELSAVGVASLKLEGRMKRPEYVATVTNIYRQALDGKEVTQEMLKELYTAFNRQGFTDGYYTGKLGQNMFGTRRETKEDEAWLKRAQQSYEAVENGLVPIRFQAVVAAAGSSLTVTDALGNVCTAYGPQPQYAMHTPLDEQSLSARLMKTGGTPYRCVEVACAIEPGLILSAASINALRRECLNQLTALRARRETPQLYKPAKTPMYPGNPQAPELTVQVAQREQVTGQLLRMNPSVLYVPVNLLAQDLAWALELRSQVNVCVVLPRIVHDGELPELKNTLKALRKLGITQALVGNLGLLIPVRECGMVARGDMGLNIYSSAAVNIARDLEMASVLLSPEMTLPQIRDVSKGVPCELMAYGRMSLMVTENCLIKGRTGECTCNQGIFKLVDKTGAEFPVMKDCGTCRTHLLNGKKLSLLDRQEELSRLGLWALRLTFTTENPREVDQVLADYIEPEPFDPGGCTRGLYLRGLD